MDFDIPLIAFYIAFTISIVILILSFFDKIDYRKTVRQLLCINWGLWFLSIGVSHLIADTLDLALFSCISGVIFIIFGITRLGSEID
jgi:hypothetical protein